MAGADTRVIAVGLMLVAILAGYKVLNFPEQTRPTSYDKGVYGGAEDQALDPDTVDDLAHRTGQLRNSGR